MEVQHRVPLSKADRDNGTGLDGHSWGDASVILLLVLGLVLFCIFVSPCLYSGRGFA